MKKLSLILIAFLLIVTATPLVLAQYKAPHTKPGPATDRISYVRVPLDIAPKALQAGDIDMYIFGLKPAAAVALRGVEGISLYFAPDAIVDIGVNPAPAPEGELNPFSIREVRFALNYLIDRDYVVNEIYRGFASPMYTFLSTYDPDYVTIYDIVAKYEFKYDPALANEIITRALTRAGAVKEAGKWYYNGKPITIKFIIRIEDERREIGDALASELEKLGFTVERKYLSFGPAINLVYGTDPARLEWHLYTEGWGKGVPEKYDFVTINQFGAPWFGWLPGYQEAGWWQYQNSTIDELGKRIYMGIFKDKAERDELYRKCTEMIIQEAVRIWIATRLSSFAAGSEVVGLTNDLGAGLRAPWNAREAYKGNASELKIGHLWVWTERTVWNPVGGFDDVYSVDIYRNVYDPATWRHPFNGLPIPFRATYEVETAGPEEKLDVPEDAVLWNAAKDEWVAVGLGVKATSKVTFDYSLYLQSKWHHGQPITWADILYAIAQKFEIAYDAEKSVIESAIAAANKPILDTIKGLRIVGESKLEVYVDYWFFDPNYIAEYAELWMNDHNPWEILLGMDDVVFNKRMAAYTDTAADKYGVPWLSLVMEDHAQMIADSIAEFDAENYFPSNVFTVLGKRYATIEEAKARYKAALEWFNEKGHLEISDGPYYLEKFDPEAQYAELRAFRDPTYPFRPGKWYFGIPQFVEIARIGIPTVVPGAEAKFIVDVKGPGTLGAKYLIKDPVTGEILIVGEAESVRPGRLVITLPEEFTKKLSPGLYEITVAAFSDEVSFVAAETQFFNVLSLAPVQKQIEKVTEQISGVETELTEQIRTVEAGLTERIEKISGDLESRIRDVSESLSKAIKVLSGNIEEVAKTVDETTRVLSKDLETVAKTVDEATKTLSGNIQTVAGTVDKVTDSLTQVNSRVTSVEASVSDLKTDITELMASLNNILYAVIVTLILVVVAIITVAITRKK